MNWKVRIFDAQGNLEDEWVLVAGSECEARQEAVNGLPSGVYDWTVTKNF